MALRTMRIVYDSYSHTDIAFSGDTVALPTIIDRTSIGIGLYSGDIHTSTCAMFDCERSVMGKNSNAVAPPSSDVYNEIVEMINDGRLKGDKGADGTNGADGANGADGVTFTPSVDSAGNLSWTNDGGLSNPATVNIKGADGAPGKDGSDATVTAANIETALGYVPVTPSALATKQDVLTDADKQSITKTGMTTGAAWTDAEQKAARERMGVDKAYELIDEITTDGEAITERVQEPDGTPYDFEKVMVVVTAPKQMGASVTVHVNFYTNNSFLSSYAIFPANKDYFYRSLYVGEIRNSILEYRSVEASIIYGSTQGGGSGDTSYLKQSATPRFTSSNITRVQFFGPNSTVLPAGILIQIYGVRA